ncbi:MAG: cell wall hydrolase [Acidobacteriota bacterium]|nr:cell wall hydrolase [Acidobacteriota bacterium]MDQ6892264.1 cell wall hydrolase [Acidobacteriota bacterium]
MRVISDDAFAALTIKAEAGGELYVGKVCVGETFRERMRQGFFSDGTVIGTCFLRLQFSVWNDDKQDNALAIRVLKTDDVDPVYQECLRAWLESEHSHNVPGAVQYYNPRVVLPAWVDEFEKVATVGNHVFMRKRA